jgi:hypothetical protein
MHNTDPPKHRFTFWSCRKNRPVYSPRKFSFSRPGQCRQRASNDTAVMATMYAELGSELWLLMLPMQEG